MKNANTPLLTSKEVLKVLTLGHKKYVGWLVERDLLPRVTLGPRSFRYRETDCYALLNLSINRGVCLTEKPLNQKTQ